MTKLHVTPSAQRDLHEIRKYIQEELHSPSAATNIISRITKKLRLLTDFPLMGASLSSIVDIETDYRFLVCGNYTAFYRYDGKIVYVIRILYSRRDFMKILFKGIWGEEE
jgi:addiction module RelE/StbE family toxin